MKIGVIGIGSIGGTLARKLAAAGHEVRVANSKGVEGARAFADEIGATAADAKGAAEGADAVILSIPLPAVATLPADIFAGLRKDAPIIDTGNYYPGIRDPQIAALDAGQVESEWVVEHIGRPIIKAFNNILAQSLAELGRPEGSPGRIAIAVAGDDAAAKQIAMTLVNEVGFDPVDGGALADSWRQQPATPGYCCDYDAAKMRRGLAAAIKGEAPQKRDTFMRRLMSLDPFPTHEQLVALTRENNGVD